MDKHSVSAGLSNPALVEFVQMKVHAWLDWRIKEGRREKDLRDMYSKFKTEIDFASSELSVLRNKHREPCIGALTKEEQELADDEVELVEALPILEDELEAIQEYIDQIIYDPNFLPTSGQTETGRLVLVDDLTLESKCMLLALWTRREYRRPVFFGQIATDESYPNRLQRACLRDLFLAAESSGSQTSFARSYHTQFDAIDIIIAEVFTGFAGGDQKPVLSKTKRRGAQRDYTVDDRVALLYKNTRESHGWGSAEVANALSTEKSKVTPEAVRQTQSWKKCRALQRELRESRKRDS